MQRQIDVVGDERKAEGHAEVRALDCRRRVRPAHRLPAERILDAGEVVDLERHRPGYAEHREITDDLDDAIAVEADAARAESQCGGACDIEVGWSLQDIVEPRLARSYRRRIDQ